MILPGVDLMKYGPWAVALGVFVTNAVKIVPDGSRLAVCRFGSYEGLRGPGLVFTIPIVEKALKIKEGDEATLKDVGHMSFKNLSVPVRIVDNVKIGSGVVVHSFSDQVVLVIAAKRTETNLS